MKISLDWLKEYIDIDETAEEIGHMLTMSGLEVEGIEQFETIRGGLSGVVIGEVMECERHPNADKLSVTKVDIGGEELSPIVCGAPNVAKGQKVLVATVGATLYPNGGEAFKIKKAKIRGEVSLGMICAEDELGLGTSHDGIMVLDTILANGTPAAEYLQISSDQVFEIGLTPNRADAASHYGVARDLKVLLDKDLNFPDIASFKPDDTSRTISIEVENPDACPRYAGLTISGVDIKASPDWLQNKLKAVGLSPINNVVDITNYILHGLGQPMHAFDADKVKGDKVIVRNAVDGEIFVTLDGQERTLKGNDLMICNEEKPMCIGGVLGGLDSGVTTLTQNIFLESAYFSADHIRKTAQQHSIKTDASFRFERGTDPNMPVKALKLAAMLIKELAGGKITSEVIDEHHKPVKNFTVEVKYKNVHRLIGKELSKVEIKTILEGLEIGIVEENAEMLTVSVPPYRVDVQREADVIEEILRIHGFNNIELSENLAASYLAEFPKKDPVKIQQKTTEMLVGAGYQEIMTNSLTKAQYAEALDGVEASENVHILNYLSEDLAVMRQSLMFSGLETIAHNVNRQQHNLKLFEFGKVYQQKGDKYTERKQLAILVSGNQAEESWLQASGKADYYTLASIVSKVMQRLGLDKFQQQSFDQKKGLDYGLELLINNQVVGRVGKVNAKLAKLAEVKQEVFYAELEWDALLKIYSGETSYQEISKFPAVRRDLSLVMSRNVTFDQIKDLAFKTERKLLKEINVFDVYEGENLGDNKKSYSVSFILHDDYKTLTDKVIDKTMNRLIGAYEKQLNILIRK
ncbi:phenylalanine--tRNA ligase subunit beta [Rapidithrix thailandica]|uniref:Phenylalanine--tRNA ligase beta subunit n=1 Tax=Rapidithrix thailandica TaxID=413964 RepID=A0AAW9RUQ6_9BACT